MTLDSRLANFPILKSAAIGVELHDAIPGRSLLLESLHWASSGPICLLYTVTPGVREDELTVRGKGLSWRCELADDVGTNYLTALTGGSLLPSAVRSPGERSQLIGPDQRARVVALTVFSARTPKLPEGHRIGTVFVRLAGGVEESISLIRSWGQ